MYHYRLRIMIFSLGQSLEEVVRTVPPFEGFEHHIEHYSSYSQAVFEQGDLIIWDLPEPSPAQLMPFKKEQAVLAVCAEAERAFSAEDYGAMDALWVKPLRPERIQFYLGIVQKQLKVRANMRLHAMYLDTVIDSIPDLVWFKDLSGAHLKVNNSFCKTVQKNKEDIIGRAHNYIWDMTEDEYAKGEYVCLESEAAVIQAGHTLLFDEKVKTKRGLRQFKTYKSPLFDDHGHIMGTCGIAHDVTDLQNMGTELELFLRSLPFAVLMVGEAGEIIDANDWCRTYFGESREMVVGQRYSQWRARNLQNLEQTKGQKDFFEATCCNQEGVERYLEVREEPLVDIFNNEIGLLCLYQDITMERHHEQQIMEAAQTDDLTGLFNRRGFYQEMTRRWQNQPVTLFYIDLDDFKKVNDTYGHDVGDKALQMVAECIVSSFQQAVIARMGGDEYVVALLEEEQSLENISQQAQAFRQLVGQQFAKEQAFRQMTVSVGIAQARAGEELTLDDLLRRGDQALYIAKQQGKNRYVLYQADEQ